MADERSLVHDVRVIKGSVTREKEAVAEVRPGVSVDRRIPSAISSESSAKPGLSAAPAQTLGRAAGRRIW
jgi:hypothetical protein